MNKSNAITLLRAFIAQRSGLSWRDYFYDRSDANGVQAYNSDMRMIGQQGRDARAMLAFVADRSISAEELERAACSAFSGRLTLKADRIDYCTGQCFGTEYRAAVCAVLAQALIRYWRDEGNDWRKLAKGYFGRGLASRWFA